MSEKIRQAIQNLPELLQDPNRWKTLHVEKPLPRVERVWTQWGDYRIHLHRIHPCSPDEALYHPHPWSQEIYVASGSYEMGIGSSANILSHLKPNKKEGAFMCSFCGFSFRKSVNIIAGPNVYICKECVAFCVDVFSSDKTFKPPIVTKLQLSAGTFYDMNHPNGWHYVAPHEEVMSIMLTGKPWGIKPPTGKDEYQLTELSEEVKLGILQYFRDNI